MPSRFVRSLSAFKGIGGLCLHSLVGVGKAFFYD